LVGVSVGVVAGVVVGVADGATGGVEGVALGLPAADGSGRSLGVGAVVVSVSVAGELVAATGRTLLSVVFSGLGVSVTRSGTAVTRGTGGFLPASGMGINGVSTRGPPSTLLTSSTTYPTTGTASATPTRRTLR
jgi:hypothetical protein